MAAADADLVPHVASVRVGDIANENDLGGRSGGGKGRGGGGAAVGAPCRREHLRTHVRAGGGFWLEWGSTAAGGEGGAADGDAGPDGVALDGAEIRA